MANPKIIETLSYVRGLRKSVKGETITLTELQLQSLARHIENIEAAVQMQAITSNSQKV